MAELVDAVENLKVEAETTKMDSSFYSKMKIDEQRELFCWKWSSVDRSAVLEQEKGFIEHNKTGTGELDEHEAATFFEDIGIVKTAVEIRETFGAMDADGNHLISFIEWCCAFFEKDFTELTNFTDEAAREAAMAEAKAAGEIAKKAEEEMRAAAEKKEKEAAERAKALEDESKLTGVAGMRAFFFRKVESAQDSTTSNKESIQQEFQRRKALREAKAKEAQAQAEANKVATVEEVADQAYKSARRASLVRHQSEKEKAELEKIQRQARKDAMNAKWGSPVGSPKP